MQTNMQPEIKNQIEKNSEIRDELGNTAVSYDGAIHKSLYMRFGINAWYKAYMTSEGFKKESPEYQQESFETYCELRDMLSFMEDRISEYDKSQDD